MKLPSSFPSILPSADVLQNIAGVETGLRRLSRATRASRLMFAVAAFFQLLIIFKPNGIDLSSYQGAVIVLLGVALIGSTAFTWWLQESKNPFRYTCTVSPFTAVGTNKDEASAGLTQRLDGLAPDLSWRLNERVQRIYHLNADALDKAADLGSHIQVSGTYLVRTNPVVRTAADEQAPAAAAELLVLPRVRIGPPGTPETMAPHVTFDLPGDASLKDGYDQLVERVYYYLANEIYSQIRTDVDHKISFLPTPYLRAAALLHEALDFARSNTLNAYDAAEALFRRAALLLAPSDPFLGARRSWFARTCQRLSTTRFSIVIAMLRGTTPLARHGVERREILLARSETGVATMRLFRRELSNLLAQPRVELYEARRFAERALDRLARLNPDADGRSVALFDAHATLSLAFASLGDSSTARRHIDQARALLPQRALQDAVYLYASSKLDAPSIVRLEPLVRGADLFPRHQLLTFARAVTQEWVWRAEDGAPRGGRAAMMVVNAYEEILKINPGHIGALANCGYVLWLCGQDDEAKARYRKAEYYQSLVPGTVSAELYYGLVRVHAAAGHFDDAYEYLSRAEAAARSYQLTHVVAQYEYFFQFMSPGALKPFADVRRKFRRHERLLLKTTPAPTRDDVGRRRVAAFILNEYGEAALQLCRRNGDPRHETLARCAFDAAIRLVPEDTRALANVAALDPDLSTRIDKVRRNLALDPTRRDLQFQLADELDRRVYQLVRLAIEARADVQRIRSLRLLQENERATLQQQQVASPHASVDSARVTPGRTPAPSEADAASPDVRLHRLNEEITRLADRESARESEAADARQKASLDAPVLRDLAQGWLEYPWMWKTSDGTRVFDASCLESTRLRDEGVWERELGDNQVRALRLLATALLASSGAAPAQSEGAPAPSSPATAASNNDALARSILQLIEKTFWPADVNTFWYLSLLASAQDEKDRRLHALAQLARAEFLRDRPDYAAVTYAIDAAGLNAAERRDRLEELIARGARGPLVQADFLWASIADGHELFDNGYVGGAAKAFERAMAAADRLKAIGRRHVKCLEPFGDEGGWNRARLRLGVCRASEYRLVTADAVMSRAIGATDRVSAATLAPLKVADTDRSSARLALERQVLTGRPSAVLRARVDACLSLVPRAYASLTPQEINVPTPVTVEIEGPTLSDRAIDFLVKTMSPRLRASIEHDTGVKVPGIRFIGSDSGTARRFRIVLNDAEAAFVEPPDGAANDADLERQFGALAGQLDVMLRRRLGLWIETQEVQNLLERHTFAEYNQDVAGHETHAHMQPLTALVRELVDQQVSVAEFADIYAVFRRRRPDQQLDEVVAAVRDLPKLRAYLPGQQTQGPRLVMGQMTTDWLGARLRSCGHMRVLVMTAEERRAIASELRGSISSGAAAALVVRGDVLRANVWRLVRDEAIEIPVIAESELAVPLGSGDREIECAAVVSASGSAAGSGAM